MRQAWRASVVCGHAWSEFDVRSPSFVKKNLQGTWTAEFMSGLSGRTFRVSGLFQTGHFPGFPFVPSRTPDWYKPSLSSELKFRLRPTLKKEAYRAFPRFLLFAACVDVLQHPWNTDRDIGFSQRQTLIADTGLGNLPSPTHMASTICLHGAHDQQVGVGDRY